MRTRTKLHLLGCIGCLFWTLSIQTSQAATRWQGHYYEYVPVLCTWDQAYAWTSSINLDGYPGHLAIVTSAAENSFISSLVPSGGYAFLGGTDSAQEGTWVWLGGLETGTVFWKDGAPYGNAYTS